MSLTEKNEAIDLLFNKTFGCKKETEAMKNQSSVGHNEGKKERYGKSQMLNKQTTSTTIVWPGLTRTDQGPEWQQFDATWCKQMYSNIHAIKEAQTSNEMMCTFQLKKTPISHSFPANSEWREEMKRREIKVWSQVFLDSRLSISIHAIQDREKKEPAASWKDVPSSSFSFRVPLCLLSLLSSRTSFVLNREKRRGKGGTGDDNWSEHGKTEERLTVCLAYEGKRYSSKWESRNEHKVVGLNKLTRLPRTEWSNDEQFTRFTLRIRRISISREECINKGLWDWDPVGDAVLLIPLTWCVLFRSGDRTATRVLWLFDRRWNLVVVVVHM